MISKYIRGMVYYANLPIVAYAPTVQSGRRPVVIVSNDVGNVFSQNVSIVPCTSNTGKKDSQPTHVTTRIIKDIETVILCENIMTVDKSCLDSFIGVLDECTMNDISEAIGIALGFTNLKLRPPTEPLKAVVGPKSRCAGGLTGPNPEPTTDRSKKTEAFMRTFIAETQEKGVAYMAKKYKISSTGAVYQRCMRYKKLLDTK